MLTVTSPLEAVIAKEEKEWHPTAKQKKFIELPFDIDEGGYGGALMAGKSDVLMFLPLLYQFHENPKFKGLFSQEDISGTRTGNHTAFSGIFPFFRSDI